MCQARAAERLCPPPPCPRCGAFPNLRRWAVGAAAAPGFRHDARHACLPDRPDRSCCCCWGTRPRTQSQHGSCRWLHGRDCGGSRAAWGWQVQGRAAEAGSWGSCRCCMHLDVPPAAANAWRKGRTLLIQRPGVRRGVQAALVRRVGLTAVPSRSPAPHHARQRAGAGTWGLRRDGQRIRGGGWRRAQRRHGGAPVRRACEVRVQAAHGVGRL